MRRRSNAAVINLTLFTLVLSIILLVNAPTSSSSTFGWTTITYEPNTHREAIPKARGACPGLAATKKPALIVARVQADGNKQWLHDLSDKYHLCIYNVDGVSSESSHNLQVPANRGHESMPYLTYIIDNFDSLPATSVFVHGSRFSWHNDDVNYDNLNLLRRLNTTSALTSPSMGYHNLRCDWSASTCTSDSLPQNSYETRLRGVIEPFNARAVSDGLLPIALQQIFGSAILGRSDAVRSQCCAQFIVSRDNVKQHTREEYIALRQWLLDGPAPPDDLIAGRIMSYLWHILFLGQSEIRTGSNSEYDLKRMNELACPKASDCYCKLYGWCDESCTKGRCLGRYQVPQNLRLPQGWIEQHS